MDDVPKPLQIEDRDPDALDIKLCSGFFSSGGNYSSLELKQNSFDAIIVSGFKV
jgi:hypothetical protein